MIDFSKNASYDISVQRESENIEGKRIKQSSERNVHVNYDFADRDLHETEHDEDTSVLTKLVKTKESEPVEKKHDRKFSKTDMFSQYKNSKQNDCELTK